LRDRLRQRPQVVHPHEPECRRHLPILMIFFSFRPQHSDATQSFDSTLMACYRAGACSVSTHYTGIIIREPPKSSISNSASSGLVYRVSAIT
jgi:hypothetical protein